MFIAIFKSEHWKLFRKKVVKMNYQPPALRSQSDNQPVSKIETLTFLPFALYACTTTTTTKCMSANEVQHPLLLLTTPYGTFAPGQLMHKVHNYLKIVLFGYSQHHAAIHSLVPNTKQRRSTPQAKSANDMQHQNSQGARAT